MHKKVTIYTDGACKNNPGPGGWAALLRFEHQDEKIITGSEKNTTNNRMELLAAISALESLDSVMKVELFTDSTYLKNGVMEWLAKWKISGWRTSNNKNVKNYDLWQRLDALLQKHQVQCHWVKAHSNHPENDRVDSLAKQAIQTLSLEES